MRSILFFLVLSFIFVCSHCDDGFFIYDDDEYDNDYGLETSDIEYGTSFTFPALTFTYIDNYDEGDYVDNNDGNNDDDSKSGASYNIPFLFTIFYLTIFLI